MSDVSALAGHSSGSDQGLSFTDAVAGGLDKPTVFIIDPDRSTHAKVRGVANTMYVACEGHVSGQEFLDGYTHDRSGCVVLEVKIPVVGGLEIQEILAARVPSPPVVFLTSHGTISIAVRAMRAGAMQFLEKPVRTNELWETIRDGLRADLAGRQNWLQRRGIEDALGTLTANERRVLTMIARGKSKRNMAADLGASVRTVELHQARLRRKLSVKGMAQLVHYAVAADLVPQLLLPAPNRLDIDALLPLGSRMPSRAAATDSGWIGKHSAES